jgi:hypothetical protein
VPFIEKQNGRRINPNAMIECADGAMWTFESGSPVQRTYNLKNVTCWSFETVADWCNSTIVCEEVFADNSAEGISMNNWDGKDSLNDLRGEKPDWLRSIQVGCWEGADHLRRANSQDLQGKRWKWRQPATNTGITQPHTWFCWDRFIGLVDDDTDPGCARHGRRHCGGSQPPNLWNDVVRDPQIHEPKPEVDPVRSLPVRELHSAPEAFWTWTWNFHNPVGPDYQFTQSPRTELGFVAQVATTDPSGDVAWADTDTVPMVIMRDFLQKCGPW